ncbi:hypothetical protein ACO0R3_003329 [Hanseniaspora guilliermondii]
MDNNSFTEDFVFNTNGPSQQIPKTPLNDKKILNKDGVGSSSDHRYKRHLVNRLSSTKKSTNTASSMRRFSFHNSGGKLSQKVKNYSKGWNHHKHSPLSTNANSMVSDDILRYTKSDSPYKYKENLNDLFITRQDNDYSQMTDDEQFIVDMRHMKATALEQRRYDTAKFYNDSLCAFLKDKFSLDVIKDNVYYLMDFYEILNIFYMEKEYQKAVELFQEHSDIANLLKDHPISIYTYCLCLYELENYHQIIAYLGEGDEETDSIDLQLDILSKEMRNSNKENKTDHSGIIDNETIEFSGIRFYYEMLSRLKTDMLLLRGKVLLKKNQIDGAKRELRKSLFADPTNYESFKLLVSSHIMTKAEIQDFYNQIPFNQIAGSKKIVELIKANYYKMISYDYIKQEDFNNEVAVVDDEYCDEEEAIGSFFENGNMENDNNMSDNYANLYLKNNHLLMTKEFQVNIIKKMFNQCSYGECIDRCEAFMSGSYDPYNEDVLTYYLTSLFEVGNKTKISTLLNGLILKFPSSWMTEFAAGTRQLLFKNFLSARKHFAKATILNPSSLASLIAYGHTFVGELDFDQAMVVYSTAATLFPGSHIPLMFLGMQHLIKRNLTTSESYLKMALLINSTDPLLLNELGVINYQRGNYTEAKKYFKKANDVISKIRSSTILTEYGIEESNFHANSKIWSGIFVNLGHTYRKLNQLEKALMCFEAISVTTKLNTNTLTSMALVCLKLMKLDRCIEYLHKALEVNPENTMASDLLQKALELNIEETHF